MLSPESPGTAESRHCMNGGEQDSGSSDVVCEASAATWHPTKDDTAQAQAGHLDRLHLHCSQESGSGTLQQWFFKQHFTSES